MITPPLVCATALAAAAWSAPDVPTETRVPILDHAALASAMQRVATDGGDAVSVVPVGTSRSGRRIDALRIARGPIAPGRPAILVVGALDGEMAWTSGLVLDHARRLVERAESDDATRALLDATTIYLVPRANPDAAEARTSKPLAERAATGVGVDDDRDGRDGEDGPTDVDGDGVIGWMRWKHAEGEWIEDPTDPRALVRADRAKGQRGQWKLARESADADGDGEVGEDAPHDGIVNRNFPQGWVEHAPESGRYATEDPEARALADFLVVHGEVALVVTYGLLDDLAEKPRTKDDGGRRSANPSDGIPGADAEIYAELGRRWKALGGTNGKFDARDAGTFQAWAQAQRGLWTVNLAPWSVPLDEKAAGDPGEAAKETKDGDGAQKGAKKKSDDAPKPSDDAKRLRWFDAHPDVAGFRPWTAFRHPALGDVEMGGFAPYALHEPPADERARIADATYSFLVSLGELMPRVRVVESKARDLGAGAWRVDAVIGNDGYLPLASALARRTRTVRPARVRLDLADGATLVAGPREELVSELAGNGGRREIAWIVRAPSIDAVSIAIDTDHAGANSTKPEVTR